jgi:C4-dicarboxylate-specific signal transduction histidine kinase
MKNMENNKEIEQSKLSFFGSITAASTHEIKNSLAVMNEAIGFIEDIIVMSEQGMPLDNELLKEQLTQLSRQVARSDMMLKKLSWFAHSIDERTEPVYIEELIDNLIELSRHLSRAKKIEVQRGIVDSSVTLDYPSFHLQNIIFTCIASTIATSDGNSIVTISGQKVKNDKARITITDSNISSPESVEAQLPLLNSLMKELGGELSVTSTSDIEDISVVLLVPTK